MCLFVCFYLCVCVCVCLRARAAAVLLRFYTVSITTCAINFYALFRRTGTFLFFLFAMRSNRERVELCLLYVKRRRDKRPAIAPFPGPRESPNFRATFWTVDLS